MERALAITAGAWGMPVILSANLRTRGKTGVERKAIALDLRQAQHGLLHWGTMVLDSEAVPRIVRPFGIGFGIPVC